MTDNKMAFFPSNFTLPTYEEDHSPPNSFHILPSYSPQDLHGVATLLSKTSIPVSNPEGFEERNEDDEYSDDGSQAGEKKIRRLNIEQVKALEKNFELGNKLDPQRKVQLARALGLQPRQIAIWFQNRRARWKTKQLEKDFHLLKRQFDSVKADNDALLAQNKKLHAQVLALKQGTINLNKEIEVSCSNGSENSFDMNKKASRKPCTESSFFSHHPILSDSQFFPQKSDLHCQTVQDDGFCNMLCGIDDQPNFWPFN